LCREEIERRIKKTVNVAAMPPPTDADRKRETSEVLDSVDTRTRCITEAAIEARDYLVRHVGDLTDAGNTVIRKLTEALAI
jgi:hypothetical protein